MKLKSRNKRLPGRPKDEELVARRRQEILEVAAEVFADQGYRQTDVQVIADRLEVGKGTIYRYFRTKEELFLSAVDEGMRQLAQSIDAAQEGESNPISRLERAVRTYLAFFDQHPWMVELLIIERAEFKERKESTYFAYVHAREQESRRTSEKAIEEGFIRRVPVDRILDVINDVLYGAIFTNHFAGRRKVFEEQASDILDVLLHGLKPHREQKDPS